MVRSINAHQNLLKVYNCSNGGQVSGGAGAKPLLGSVNTVWCYGFVRLGLG